MDPAGARALAKRLAEGKEPAEMTLDERLIAQDRALAADEPEEPPEPLPPAAREDGVVYVRAAPRSSRADVWIYVLGSDGHLRRAR